MKNFSKSLTMLFIALVCLLFAAPAQASFSPPSSQISVEVEQNVIPKKETAKKHKKKDSKKRPNQTQEKHFIVAFLLFWFLGFLGIHRFYLGYNGMGVLYLFTAAIFGIGWIIDLILFIVGGLPPKGKDSYKE